MNNVLIMRRLLLIPLMTAIAATAVARDMDIPKGYQHDVNATYDRITERGPYLTNRFFDNIFIGAGGGLNMYFGKYDKDGDIENRFAPALDVNIGKWITPSVGLRVQYTGLKAKGYSRTQGCYTSGPLDENDNVYPKKFNVFSIHGDVLWNISNGIGGFKETRFWDFIPFLGFGWAKSERGSRSFENFAMSAGLLNKLRLSKHFHITLEARGMMVDGRFDSFAEDGNDWDCMTSLTAGLQYTFGPKRGFKRPRYVAPTDYAPYIERISDLEKELAEAGLLAGQLAKNLETERNKPAERIVEVPDIPVSLQVFFKINSAVVTDEGMLNLARIAETIKATPDIKYTVVGYADSATGAAKINNPLSLKRAEAVVKILTERFGVSPSQLLIDSKGGIENSKKIELDRTVIITKER